MNQMGMGGKWAALLLDWDSLQQLQSGNTTTVSVKALWYTQIVYEWEIDSSALERSVWNPELYQENCTDLSCCICSLLLGRCMILLCTFWAVELGTSDTLCSFCPALLTCTVCFAPKQLRELCNYNLYRSKSPSIKNFEFPSTIKINLTAHR